MTRPVRTLARLAAVGIAVGASGVALAVPMAQPALACVPSVTGTGPTVTVTPDLAHPLQSSVSYDSSDFSVVVNACLH